MVKILKIQELGLISDRDKSPFAYKIDGYIPFIRTLIPKGRKLKAYGNAENKVTLAIATPHEYDAKDLDGNITRIKVYGLPFARDFGQMLNRLLSLLPSVIGHFKPTSR